MFERERETMDLLLRDVPTSSTSHGAGAIAASTEATKRGDEYDGEAAATTRARAKTKNETS
jgi:hypothetical protein